MTLTHILIFSLAALFIRGVRRPAWRSWLLLGVSVLAIFWMQPALPIRGLDFWLPVATLLLAALCWAAVTPPEQRFARENIFTALALAGMVLGIALTRYFSLTGLITPSRPPQTYQVTLGLVVATGIGAGLLFLPRSTAQTQRILLGLLLALFVAIKLPALSAWISAGLRHLTGQPAALATANDLRWLGFSYVAFRLIHTLRDRQTGRLPLVNLQEYLIYAIFFPAFTAGPLDRLERFVQDLRQGPLSAADDLLPAGQRLVIGLFKKYALADSLALIALNATNAAQVRGAGWAWLLLYAYAWMIYLDFSGYTDIAIGLARLVGVHLPENFHAPYWKPNLTQFWNHWHITLTMWFRGYFYNPLTRALLRRRKKTIPPFWIELIVQVATMLLIGLWHGITVNFALWGLWHGLGLFAHSRWSNWARKHLAPQRFTPWQQKLLTTGSTLLTFHFVALGWVFFALPTPELAWRVLQRLFGG